MTGADPLILQFLTRTPDGGGVIPRRSGAWVARGSFAWVARGSFHDGRAWAVESLTFDAARLHVWTPGRIDHGSSDATWDYANEALAALAAYEWEGIGDEPSWWRRCNRTGRRRTYADDGTHTEEVRA